MEVLRDHTGHPPIYCDEHLFVDLRHARAMLDSQPLILTRKEYRLLALLVIHAGEIVPRKILLTQVWGYVPSTRTRTLDAHIGRLRKKLGDEGRRIETIFGKGYRFCLSQNGRSAPANVERNDQSSLRRMSRLDDHLAPGPGNRWPSFTHKKLKG